ncbi:MAG: amidohydrolase family protein [Chloroflexota bacterium]|nr:amidohydrolase family protein [Chloroflexota bacterium]
MKEQFDLLLTGGIIVTGERIRRADVGVRGEIIAAIEPDLPREAVPENGVIDVTGKYVFPGIIDVHVHPVYLDSVQDCSRVAAYGGTTTLLHYAYARTGDNLVQKVEEMLEDGLENSLLDFSLHGGMFEAHKQLADVPQVFEMGVRTFKFFMPYIKQGWTTDDYHLAKAMDMLAELGGMAMVHAENGGAIDYLEDKYLTGPDAADKKHPLAKYFNTTRPAAMEEEAIFRAIRMAEVMECPLYIAHNTTARAIRHIREAQEAGLPVYAETCPQYLTLTKEILEERGALAKIGPPIRTAADRAGLWDALAEGVIQTVATDHAPKHKDVDGDFLEQPFGAPQIETLLPLVYDGGVNSGRISVVRLVQVLCENPARIFGLYPKKGAIAVGSDADLVVFDPARAFTIRAENQHSNAGYTLYEGRNLLGWPEMTFQRGRRVLWRGEIVAEPGRAQFLETLAS